MYKKAEQENVYTRREVLGFLGAIAVSLLTGCEIKIDTQTAPTQEIKRKPAETDAAVTATATPSPTAEYEFNPASVTDSPAAGVTEAATATTQVEKTPIVYPELNVAGLLDMSRDFAVIVPRETARLVGLDVEMRINTKSWPIETKTFDEAIKREEDWRDYPNEGYVSRTHTNITALGKHAGEGLFFYVNDNFKDLPGDYRHWYDFNWLSWADKKQLVGKNLEIEQTTDKGTVIVRLEFVSVADVKHTDFSGPKAGGMGSDNPDAIPWAHYRLDNLGTEVDTHVQVFTQTEIDKATSPQGDALMLYTCKDINPITVVEDKNRVALLKVVSAKIVSGEELKQ